MTPGQQAIIDLVAELQKALERNPPVDEAIISLKWSGYDFNVDLNKVFVTVDGNDVLRIGGFGDPVGIPIGRHNGIEQRNPDG